MALDWNKKVSLGDLFGKVGKKGTRASGDTPFKTTMNLYQPKRNASNSPTTTILVAVLLVVLIIAFTKFGVLDQLARVDAAQAQLSQTQAQVSALEAKLTDYAEIEERFLGYTTQFMSNDIDLNDTFELIETYVMPNANVTKINLADSILTLECTNVTLDGVGAIAQAVKGYPLVRSVNVSTAATDANVNTVTANMTITLITAADTVQEAAGKTGSSDLFAGLDTDGHSLVPSKD